MRKGHYSQRPVRCPNANRLGFGKVEATHGDVLTWIYSNGVTGSGRMLARVSAPAEGPDVPDIKGWIAVLELRGTFDHAYVRWIDPVLVTEIRSAPKTFPAWFFGDLPSLDKILAADEYGSLDEHHLDRAKAEGRL